MVFFQDKVSSVDVKWNNDNELIINYYEKEGSRVIDMINHIENINIKYKKISIGIDNPKEGIAETDIKNVMDVILEKNIFQPNGMELLKKEEAKIVVTDTTEYDLV